jgi:predicted kinase
MRDRLKRRKKSQESASPQPAPLQPAYFEPQAEAAEPQSEKRTDIAEPAMEAVADVPPGPEAGNAEPVESGQSGGQTRRPRRRRGRGGRGRRRTGQTPAAPAETQAEPIAETPAPIPAAAPVATPSAAQASKGVVVLAIGLPGSGKSSWFKRHNINPLSSDMVRQVLFDDATEQRFQDLVFSNLRSMLRARLIARRPMNYLDATNLTPHDRHGWIKLAKDFAYEAQAVYFDVPLEVCLERNQRRKRTVSEDVMRKMAAQLKPPSFDEGFTKITVVRVKQKER